MEDVSSQLKLENQICFPLYAVSRLVIQQYKPLLDELNVTYPQYLVLLVLWEREKVSVKDISEKLLLETNTLTPLLKRMESNGLIHRNRSKTDERVVIISLTPEGKDLQAQAKDIPKALINNLDCFSIEKDEILVLKKILDGILEKTKNS
ncbi:MarR family winged helix-turn-helix transcriptional regulator [Formosa sp. L2A11]|uniref:MarR family winged helix-turn-helix transcriptional regulator n=1 Tax=Formosa sp. L2A11 TaxID=2686363 RepID=UPI00131E2558|nr:MarR family transcriptional regulator [Formosa sp. L2A11]